VDIVEEYLPPAIDRELWNVNKISNNLRINFLINTQGINFKRDSRDEILAKIVEKAKEVYRIKEKFIGSELLRQIEKFEILRVMDGEWMHHLHSMDYLKEGIQLRAYGQKDPLLEYKQEAHKMFFEMEDSVRRKTVENLFRIQIAKEEKEKNVFLSGEEQFIHNERSALEEGKKTAKGTTFTSVHSQGSKNLTEDRPEAKGAPKAPFKRKTPKVGRNDPCPCGKVNPKTGKSMKYKFCCYPKYG